MLKSIVIKKRWKIMESIGKGAFGELYSAYDMVTNGQVAIKVEGPLNRTSHGVGVGVGGGAAGGKRKRALLAMEISVLRKMQDSQFVCRFEACGRITIQSSTSSTTYDYMVMQLLGPSLSKLRRKYKKFSLSTTALLGKQMLMAIKDCHTIGGVIHRDIKPGNFCIDNHSLYHGRPRCYIIDFGLCRPYISSNGKIKEARRSVGFRGTAAYASINAHDGKDLGRVDDLWSLFYVLVEFMTGDLPWKGRDKEQVAVFKRQMTNSLLVSNLPSPFLYMLNYLQTLHFEDEPDYDLIDGYLDDLFAISGKPYDVPYDWDIPRTEEYQFSDSSKTLYTSNLATRHGQEGVLLNNNNGNINGKFCEINDNNSGGRSPQQQMLSNQSSANALLTPPYSPIYSNANTATATAASGGCVSPFSGHTTTTAVATKKMMAAATSPGLLPTSPSMGLGGLGLGGMVSSGGNSVVNLVSGQGNANGHPINNHHHSPRISSPGAAASSTVSMGLGGMSGLADHKTGAKKKKYFFL